MYRIKSSISRMWRRREYVHVPQLSNGEYDVSQLSSLNTRCLHTNDKKLIRILLVVMCFSAILQKTVLNTTKKTTLNFQPSAVSELRDPATATNSSSIVTVSSDVTVVTAFFDIGAFPKGAAGNQFTPLTYLKWAKIFKYLTNPLVVYTDSEMFATRIRMLRIEAISLTQVVMFDRNTSWAFDMKSRIADVYSTPGYPKHLPNTVVPDYACAQIAKYEVISRAAKDDIFKTKYYTWVDVGYFRDRKSKHMFSLEKPVNFDDTKVAMNLINFGRSMDAPVNTIFTRNLVWVGGGLVFATRDVIIQYEQQFKRAVEYFLSQGVMNTDQQLTYAMFSNEGRAVIKPEVELQVYKPPSQLHWFWLGFSMIHEVN